MPNQDFRGAERRRIEEIQGVNVRTQGFTRLIQAVKRTSGDDRNRVRTHLVEMFEIFPEGDERVAKARRNLASALF